MSALRHRPTPRIRGWTWLSLAIYACVVLGHFALIQAPGALVDVHERPLRMPADVELLSLRILGDGHHALAAVRAPTGGALWLIDWGRIREVTTDTADTTDAPQLDALRLAETASAWIPEQVAGAAGSWRWIEGPHSERTSTRWTPPSDAERTPVGADLLWENDDGAIDRPAIDAQLRGGPTLQSARRLAILSEETALLRLAAADDPTRLQDDLVLVDRRDGRVLKVLDTYPLGVVAQARSGGFFFTDGLHSRLTKIRCTKGVCEVEPGILSTGGPRITAVADDPTGELLALCTVDGRLMTYGVDDDGARFLGEHALTQGCQQLVVVDRSQLLVGGDLGWSVVTLTPRGGWLR